jgi:hypothetical protein
MLVLAVATSIDALIVGVTLPMLGAPPVLSLVTIGVTTALLRSRRVHQCRGRAAAPAERHQREEVSGGRAGQPLQRRAQHRWEYEHRARPLTAFRFATRVAP